MSKLTIGRASLTALVLTGLAVTTLAQQPPPPPPITMKQLKPDVWAGLGGAGGNSTIIIGKTGVIVVDAKQTEAGAKDLLAEIAKITPKPVTTVIITHSDGDHVNGLVAFPAGIKIIAHENNKKEQEAALAAGGRGAPPADGCRPRSTTKNKETMTIDGVKLELYHWAPAHTSGDLIVYLPDEKIVSTGDIVVTNRADDNPNIHFEKNGSTEGWLANVKGMIGLNADDLRHRPRRPADQGRSSAEARRDHGASGAKIAAMVKEGKTLDEIKAALPDAPAPARRAAARGAAAPGAARAERVAAADPAVLPP